MGPVWDFDGTMDNYIYEPAEAEDLGFEIKAMTFTPEQLEKPKPHIDKEWQKEIFRDNLDEYIVERINEVNKIWNIKFITIVMNEIFKILHK